MIRFAFAAMLALLCASAVADTAPRVAPQSGARLSLAPVVKKVAPAVVNVYASRVDTMPRNPLFDDPIFRRFFGGGGGEDQRVQKALGSGVIVDPSGLVVTNHHVIEGMTDVKVALADKREFEAEIVLRDPRTDLAVLRIKGGENFPVLELGDSDALEVGDFVIAIGDPFGVGQTVTQGIVSALARTQIGINDYGFFIQTDAAINPGNSGGALVDLDGKLVGINSAIYSRSGGSMGIGFAIPVNMVKSVVAAARHGGTTVRRPWLGATLQNVSKDIADNLGLERPTGALVVEVVERGSGGRGGPQARRRHLGHRQSERRRRRERRLSARRQAAWGRGEAHGPAQWPLAGSDAEARLRAGSPAARRAHHSRPVALRRRPGDESVARCDGGTVARRARTRVSSSPRSATARPPPRSACRRATSSSRSTGKRSRRPATSKRPAPSAPAGGT